MIVFVSEISLPFFHLCKSLIRNKSCSCILAYRVVFVFSVCKGAKADVVFLIDGSWSIGDDSFSKVVQFVFSVVGAFDVISPSGMQVLQLVCDFEKSKM